MLALRLESTRRLVFRRYLHVDKQTKTDIEAAAFRSLIGHLQDRKDVQNIDLMNLAGFCRNCLSKWYLSAAQERDVILNYEQARETIYGMSSDEWKLNYQKEATPEQKANYKKTKPLHAVIDEKS